MKPPYEESVSSKYGAPMGRRSSTVLEGKVHLRRVPFYDGCYDKGGAYWGSPANLYCAWDSKGNAVYCRATSRAGAKAILRWSFIPDVLTFYR